MKFTHFTGIFGLLLGTALQEYCFFQFRTLSLPKSMRNMNVLLLIVGISLEISSLAVIPLSTYVLLSCFHIVFFKHLLITDEKRKYTIVETFGTMAIISGIVICALFGGIQSEINYKAYLRIFDLFYYGYTFVSLVFNLVIRRFGLFSGRIIVETGIPAQISSFAVAALKIFWLSVDSFTYFSEFIVILICLLIICLALLVSNSFICEFCKNNDLVIVMGGYYIWSLAYCVPMSLFMNPGVNHSVINYIAIIIGCSLIVPGIYLHSFTKIEYLKAYKEKKNFKDAVDFII